MGLLDGKVAMAIGGGSGIGRAVLERFVAEGARAGVLERYPEKLTGLSSELGDAVVGIPGNATRYADHERAVATTIEAFGRIDLLLCFAAVHDAQASLAEIPSDRLESAYRELYSVNVLSNLFAAKAALPALIESRGTVILTVSHAGFFADGGGVLYTSSKFAVRGLVTQLAHELAPHIRVNGVAPGFALTPLRGLESLGHEGVFGAAELTDARGLMAAITPYPYEPVPDTHVGPYLFLAAESLSPALTGVIVNSDGGSSVRGFQRVSGGVDLAHNVEP